MTIMTCPSTEATTTGYCRSQVPILTAIAASGMEGDAAMRCYACR